MALTFERVTEATHPEKGALFSDRWTDELVIAATANVGSTPGLFGPPPSGPTDTLLLDLPRSAYVTVDFEADITQAQANLTRLAFYINGAVRVMATLGGADAEQHRVGPAGTSRVRMSMALLVAGSSPRGRITNSELPLPIPRGGIGNDYPDEFGRDASEMPLAAGLSISINARYARMATSSTPTVANRRFRLEAVAAAAPLWSNDPWRAAWDARYGPDATAPVGNGDLYPPDDRELWRTWAPGMPLPGPHPVRYR